MSLRRYVNLLVLNHRRGIYSLHRLNRDHFFFPTEEAAKARDLPRLRKVPPFSWFEGQKKKKQAAASVQPERIRLPPPIFSVRPTPCPMTRDDEPLLKCFPLSESKIFFADSAARITFYDTDARCITTTPNLHGRKYFPFALSVPSAGPGGEQDGGDGSLYIMDTLLDPKKSFPFEALVWRNHPDDHCTAPKTWHCDTLPLPPFVHDPGYKPATIFSYAVVGDVICISTIGVGTYCFDTVSRTWSPAGDWQMPFYGKAEYVPELKLWFGMSGDNPQLPCAADLSPVLRGHAPKQRYVWGDPDRPEEWLPHMCGSDKIVSLGSGRFCITNFFEAMEGSSRVNDEFGEVIAVFTGLEVLAGNGSGSGNGNRNGNGLRMIKHKSRILHTDSIESVL